MNRPFTIFSTVQGIIEIRFPADHQDPSKRYLPFTGGIATIATILASNNINLKNIGIIHNREFEEGVLRIEFYDDASSRKASELLQKYRYLVYER